MIPEGLARLEEGARLLPAVSTYPPHPLGLADENE
jgi:hypothetical protein